MITHPYPETRETYRLLFAAMREQVLQPRPRIKAKRRKAKQTTGKRREG